MRSHRAAARVIQLLEGFYADIIDEDKRALANWVISMSFNGCSAIRLTNFFVGIILFFTAEVSFAYQRIGLDIGLIGPIMQEGKIPNHRLIFEKENFLILERQIGTILFNDTWQFASAFNRNLKFFDVEIWPGFALSQSVPQKTVSVSPMFYLSHPQLFSFLGKWDFEGDFYPFADGLFFWSNINNKFKLWNLKLKAALGLSSNLKYQPFETANLINVSLGAIHEF